MGLRFRKSIKICKGVRLNLSKSGVGFSFGTRGLRYSVGADGRNRASIGVPGTGVYYQTSASRNNTTHKSNNGSTTVHYESGSYTYTRDDVVRYQRLIEFLTESHKKSIAEIHWNNILRMNAPFVKGEVGPNERRALAAYNSITPTFFEKLNKTKFEERKKEEYKKVVDARNSDIASYSNWKHDHELAERIIGGDIDAYYEVIGDVEPFQSLSKLGSDFEFGTDDAHYVEVEFQSKSDEVIPEEKLVLTSTGKVSRKVLSKTDMFDIVQDYVCSCSIRVARELFAALPIDTVFVHVVESNNTILSVKFEKIVFDKTDFSHIDASDYVESFLHNMKFMKTQGFRPVDRLLTSTVDLRVDNEKQNTSVYSSMDTRKKIPIEIPFGWETQNAAFVEPRDQQLWNLSIAAGKASNIDDEIKLLKEFIAFYYEYKEECGRKGLIFAKYFEEMHTYANKKKDEWIGSKKARLEELENGYLDIKEKEQVLSSATGTIKEDIVRVIVENQGILQKDLYSHFNPLLKELIYSTLYELLQEGRLTKEKLGNSNKLYIK